MSRPSQPAQAPPPFPDPILLSARRVTGSILSHENDGTAEGFDAELQAASKPPRFEPRASISILGNILLIDRHEEEKEPLAILLQRKLEETVFGSVRVGYVLKRPPADDPDNVMDALWDVQKSPEGSIYPHEMVEVAIEEKSKALGEGNEASVVAKDPKSELSALQMIASHDPQGLGHVRGAMTIATDQRFIYTVSQYHGEGSLFDYCAAVGNLSENDARFFFRQILVGLTTLQSVGICHRKLSLETVYLRGTTCSIVNLSSALRIPTADEDGSKSTPSSGTHQHFYMIQPQPPCGTLPQFVAPELVKADVPFDGFAVDLWACGVMLMSMLLGSDAIFSAPVPDDRVFKEICIDGNLAGYLKKLKKRKKKENKASSDENDETEGFMLSDDAIDLLQRMLKEDPRSRLTLDEVKEHAWVNADAGEDFKPPQMRLQSNTLPQQS